MTIHITTEQAIELLDRAVAEKGEDYVYPEGKSCQYAFDGAPSCIVGHALSYLGITLEQLAKLDHTSTFAYLHSGLGSSDISSIAPYLGQVIGVTLSDGAVKVLKSAQVDQDRRSPWGFAVETAKVEATAFDLANEEE